MAIEVYSTPYLTSGGDESGLSAANSQAPFEFQRIDYRMGEIDDNGGFEELILNSVEGDVTGDFAAGEKIIYFGLTTGSPVKADTGPIFRTITSTSWDGTQTHILTTTAFTTAVIDTYSVNKIYDDYHVLIEVMLPDNSAREVDELFIYVPKQNGYLFFDLGPLLQGVLLARSSKYIAYSVQYSEFFDGTQTSVSQIAEPLDAVLARRQIGKLKGTNLWNWVLKAAYGRIFTDFHEPKIWKGHVRTLDICFDVQMGNRINPLNSITVKIDGMNINKVVNAATDSTTILPNVWYDTPQMYAIDLKTVIELPAFADSEYVQISVLDSSTDLIVPLVCKISDPC
jgi:hypothetical protein